MRTYAADDATGTPEKISLSPRERQIVAGVVLGLRDKEIAARFHIGDGSVRQVLRLLYVGLDVSGRTQLLTWAQQHRTAMCPDPFGRVPRLSHPVPCASKTCISEICETLRIAHELYNQPAILAA